MLFMSMRAGEQKRQPTEYHQECERIMRKIRPSYGILSYRFFQGVSAALTGLHLIAPRILTYGFTITLPQSILICGGLGGLLCLFAYRSENARVETLQLAYERVADARKQKEETIDLYLKTIDLNGHSLDYKRTWEALLKAEAIEQGRTVRYEDPNPVYYHLFRSATLFSFAYTLAYGVMKTAIASFIALHSLPVWFPYLVSGVIGLIAVTYEYLKASHDEKDLYLANERANKEMRYLSAYQTALGHYPEELKQQAKDALIEQPEEKAESKGTGVRFNASTIAKAVRLNPDMKKRYFLLSQIEKIHTTCCNYLFRVNVTELYAKNDEDLTPKDNLSAKFAMAWRSNIRTAYEIIHLCTTILKDKENADQKQNYEDPLAAISHIKQKCKEARGRSMWSCCFFAGNSLLADMIEPLLETTYDSENQYDFSKDAIYQFTQPFTKQHPDLSTEMQTYATDRLSPIRQR